MRKKLLGLGGLAGITSLGYLLKDQIGSIGAYLIESFQRSIYQNITSAPWYTSLVPKNMSNEVFNYYMEKLHPINAKLGSDIATLLFLTLGLAAAGALVGYLASKID